MRVVARDILDNLLYIWRWAHTWMSLVSVTTEIASKDCGFITVNEFVIVEFTTVSRDSNVQHRQHFPDKNALVSCQHDEKLVTVNLYEFLRYPHKLTRSKTKNLLQKLSNNYIVNLCLSWFLVCFSNNSYLYTIIAVQIWKYKEKVITSIIFKKFSLL